VDGNVNYREGKDIKAWRVPGSSHLRIELIDDQVILSARIKRFFPLSSPDQFFSIQTADDKEVCVIRKIESCDAETLALITEELDRRYFSPQISRIAEFKTVPGMLSFKVETNRGPIEFYVRNWRDSSYEVEPGRWHITSVDGIRFEIPDLSKLDRRSQWFLERLL
jgi:hypothetical protein